MSLKIDWERIRSPGFLESVKHAINQQILDTLVEHRNGDGRPVPLSEFRIITMEILPDNIEQLNPHTDPITCARQSGQEDNENRAITNPPPYIEIVAIDEPMEMFCLSTFNLIQDEDVTPSKYTETDKVAGTSDREAGWNTLSSANQHAQDFGRVPDHLFSDPACQNYTCTPGDRVKIVLADFDGPDLETDALDSNLERSREKDFQIVASIRYKSRLFVEMYLEISLDQPVPMFLSLPVKLYLRQVILDGNVVYAQVGNKQCLSLLPSASQASAPPTGKFAPDGETGDGSRFVLDFIFDVEIGDPQVHVLRSVSKVEKFLKEHLYKLIERRLVYPNFIFL